MTNQSSQFYTSHHKEVKILKYLLIITISLCLASTVSQAGPYNGSNLLEACSAEKGEPYFDQNSAYCLGYIVASTGHLGSLGHSCHSSKNPSASLGEIKNVIIDYVENHPKTKKLDAHEVVFQALTKTYPCK